MDLEYLLRLVQSFENKMNYATGLKKDPATIESYDTVQDPDGFERLNSSKLPAIGQYNDGQERSLFDKLTMQFPGLREAWGREVLSNKLPEPRVEDWLKATKKNKGIL